ncbi:protein downstream neighbor of son homolog [Anopheles ziemanni]|uniref:protein downstream neighbor of son homolog n=1 Tax=Anopheles coustani TaxID=139045 RepID=UPI00265A0082|nr:protein downstream neighbor of son homolog [Anopheles coustani]XP_058171809.1 protein downstream neighbor of son homolog [Anopheles ziemanni]
MSSSNTEGMFSNPSQWKRPEDILKMQRLKRKQKALQDRINNQSKSVTTTQSSKAPEDPIASRFESNTKRKNPFSRATENNAKRPKGDVLEDLTATGEDSVFELLSKTSAPVVPQLEAPVVKPLVEQQFLQQQCPVEQTLPELVEEPPKTSKQAPIHWSIKSKLRIICRTPIPGTNLKTNQEASGLTSFVRCIDPKESSTGLDISPGARFYQATLYWQHPYLPWFTLFPRNSRNNNTQTPLDESVRTVLAKEWVTSFRNLFQLVRARQCPYFYLCANSFTVLFRAAGIGGRVETHAIMTPTSRGMRAALKQEEIEFTMPLKKSSNTQETLNRSAESGIGNGSFSNSSEEQSQTAATEDASGDRLSDEDDDDDLDGEQWLESLGVDAAEIRKISDNHTKKVQKSECGGDYSDQSLVLIEGSECQAFFNFLLNAKSTIAKVGRLSGIPPTLLAPVSFVGATLRSLQSRSTKIRMDGQDYHSTELHGVILPHILPYLTDLLCESKDKYSVTLATVPNTAALCEASRKLINDSDKENDASALADPVFGKENLSDCGINMRIVETMCRATKDSVFDTERLLYNQEEGGFSWS